MKTLKLNFKNIAVIAIIATAVFAVSCDKDDDFITQEEASLKAGHVERPETSKALPPGDDPIAQIAIDNGFDSLVVALSYVDAELGTGLVNMFMYGKDQYTVFAPTNTAFENLVGVDGKISDLPASLVKDVLFYHVTEGRRASNSVVPKNGTRTIETLLGEYFWVNPDLSIDAIGNSANILAADISASNGIVHVIDTVILPIE